MTRKRGIGIPLIRLKHEMKKGKNPMKYWFATIDAPLFRKSQWVLSPSNLNYCSILVNLFLIRELFEGYLKRKISKTTEFGSYENDVMYIALIGWVMERKTFSWCLMMMKCANHESEILSLLSFPTKSWIRIHTIVQRAWNTVDYHKR